MKKSLGTILVSLGTLGLFGCGNIIDERKDVKVYEMQLPGKARLEVVKHIVPFKFSAPEDGLDFYTTNIYDSTGQQIISLRDDYFSSDDIFMAYGQPLVRGNDSSFHPKK